MTEIFIQARPRCGSCGADVHHGPTWHDDRPFCCAGCAVGGPCICSYDLDADLDAAADRSREVR
jgi:hypothetical protein